MKDVLKASLTVGSALQVLQAGGGAAAVLARTDQAGAAVRDLHVSRLATVLGQVLEEIERCRLSGECTSARLDGAVQTAAITLTLQTARDQI